MRFRGGPLDGRVQRFEHLVHAGGRPHARLTPDGGTLISASSNHSASSPSSRLIWRIQRFGSLVRFLVRMGESPSVATQVLAAIHAMGSCEFWSDELSYVDDS